MRISNDLPLRHKYLYLRDQYKPQQVFERFKQYQFGQLAISSITASELAFDVEKSGSERNKQVLNKFLSPLDILPYDEQAIWHYAKLRQDLQISR